MGLVPLAILCGLLALPSRRTGTDVVEVRVHGTAERDRLLRQGFDVLHVRSRDGLEREDVVVRMLADPAARARLAALGFRAAPLAHDVDRATRPSAGVSSFASTLPGPPGFGQSAMGGCYTFSEVMVLLDQLRVQYPQLISAKQTIGTSVEGRPIVAVKISDHPDVSEPEPRALFDALHHAREPASMQSMIWFMHHLLSNYGSDARITALVNERELWFVPVVNPDGYVFNEVTQPGGGGLWRKNRRVSAGGAIGVDLNRNYPYAWGQDDLGSSPDPASEVFRGASPLSEPETTALDAFVGTQQFELVWSVHAHGELMMFPFSASNDIALQDVALYREHGACFAAHSDDRIGSVSNLLGLGNGSALDHHHAAHGAMSWTPEVGTSFWPTPAELFATAMEQTAVMMRAAELAGSAVDVLALDVVESSGDGDGVLEPGEIGDVLVTLRNRGLRATTTSITLTLASQDGHVALTKGSGLAPPIPATSTVQTAFGALRVAIASNAPIGTPLAVALTLGVDGSTSTVSGSLVIGKPRRLLFDDVESDLGWTRGVPGDTATTGKWLRADPKPIAQGADVAQPNDDATIAPGKFAFVTGNAGTAAGQDDVDDGVTTLVSPRFDLSHAHEPRLSLSRWSWCSKADDPLRIELSNDGGATYVTLEASSAQAPTWERRTFRVADFVPPTSAMRLRVRAEDPTNDSVTEALIDDFEVLEYGDAPHVGIMGRVTPGARFELQLASTPNQAAILLYAQSATTTTIPGVLGTLGLEPSQLVALFAFTQTQDGFVRLPIDLPPDPQLVGATAWLQLAELAPMPRLGHAVPIVIGN
ncbi:MAG: zinc carboxypeptidase [Planctomycetes bacterium]|nr:zinc carboxypeptidase [Planctomycetota bacterium]MCC7171993.1 zinc carboxypeptidase [Planctomycetota bacterium]